MPTSRPFLDLFAKAGFVIGLFVPIFLAVRYPEIKHEAEAYAQAPICATEGQDSAACRRPVDADVVDVRCAQPGSVRDKLTPPESCQLELRIDGQRRFLDLSYAWVAERARPARLRVEVFRGLPMAALIDGQWVRRHGNPDYALAMMRKVGWIWLGIWLVCGVYLLRRRKEQRAQAATSSTNG